MGTILTPIDAEVKASHFEKCYASPVGQNGIDEKNSVISQHIKMCLQDGEWFSAGVPQYCRNNNMLVIGNKENYVTHFFIPNILMANADFVIYDPENELYEACAPELIKNGYKIETVNEKDAGSFNITSLNNPSEKIAVFINDNNYLAGFVQKTSEVILSREKKEEKKWHVSIMLPYFESIGRIQNIDKYLACLRSSNASIKIGTDSTSKIQEIYEENMLAIVDSCDTTVFYKGDPKFATTKDAPPEGKCYVHIRGEFIVIDNVA